MIGILPHITRSREMLGAEKRLELPTQSSEDKAIEHYEKFLDLWKDADSGIAEVEDAKDSLAELY